MAARYQNAAALSLAHLGDSVCWARGGWWQAAWLVARIREQRGKTLDVARDNDDDRRDDNVNDNGHLDLDRPVGVEAPRVALPLRD
jgi:hypothetical protein